MRLVRIGLACVALLTASGLANAEESVLDKVKKEGVLKACVAQKIAFIPYFPLGAGDLKAARKLEQVAGNNKATSNQVALAWLLQRAPNMLPIPGTSSVAHLEENVASQKLALSVDDVRLLEAAA